MLLFIRIDLPRRFEAVEDLVPQPLHALHPEAIGVVPTNIVLVDVIGQSFVQVPRYNTGSAIWAKHSCLDGFLHYHHFLTMNRIFPLCRS